MQKAMAVAGVSGGQAFPSLPTSSDDMGLRHGVGTRSTTATMHCQMPAMSLYLLPSPALFSLSLFYHIL